MKREISVSSSFSFGGCREADLAASPTGIVTPKVAFEEEDSAVVVLLARVSALSDEDGVSNVLSFSVTSFSDPPFDAASGILFKGLLDDEETRRLVLTEGPSATDNRLLKNERSMLFSYL